MSGPAEQAAAEKAAADKLAADQATKAAAEKAAADKLAADKLAEANKKKEVDPAKYDRYTNLKLLALSETKLTDEIKQEISTLEKELKACSGRKPVRTCTAAIGNETTILIEGIPVTKEIEGFVKDAKATGYYFGK